MSLVLAPRCHKVSVCTSAPHWKSNALLSSVSDDPGRLATLNRLRAGTLLSALVLVSACGDDRTTTIFAMETIPERFCAPPSTKLAIFGGVDFSSYLQL